MVKYMEEKAHAEDFCKEFCTDIAQEKQAKCVSACVNRAENTLHTFEPEQSRIIISRHYPAPQATEHHLKDERSDLIGALRNAINQMNIGQPGDFPKLVTNVQPNVRFDIKQTDANGLGGILNAW
jgi:hypothetical protein